MSGLRDAVPRTIATTRLTLRTPELRDVADLVALANNPRVNEHTATLPFPYLEQDGQDFIASLNDSDKPRSYAIANGDDYLIGVMLLKCIEGQLPELGYWLGEPHWGQGYASEAATGLLAAIAPMAQKVCARVLAANPASVRVLEKAGFIVIEETESVFARHAGKPLLIMEWTAP